jgi:hypothetical protein
MLLAQGENAFTGPVREDTPAYRRTQAEEITHYYAPPSAEGVLSVERQRSRYRGRRRRRRSRRAIYPHKIAKLDSTRSGAVPVGSWGGEHIALQVTESGATFEIDCAHGTIEGRLSLDPQGRFDNPGSYVRESGGPDREGQRPETHRARFTGWSDGRKMTLKMTLTDTGQTIGEFALAFGAEPQMTKCL